MKPHAFTKRVAHWNYCAQCGLIEMRNAASRRAAKAECPGKNQRLTGDAADRLWAQLKREGFA